MLDDLQYSDLKNLGKRVVEFDAEERMTKNCALETGVWPNAYIPTEEVYSDMRFFLVHARECRATAAKLKEMMGKDNYPCGTYSEGYYRGLAQAYRGAASYLRRRISPDRPRLY